MIESSLPGALKDWKGQAAGVDATTTKAPGLEGLGSLRRRGRRASGNLTSSAPCYTSSASGHTVEDPLMSVQLAPTLLLPVSFRSQIRSFPRPRTQPQSAPSIPGSKGQASALQVGAPLVFTTAPGELSLFTPPPLCGFSATREGSALVYGSGQLGLSGYSQRTKHSGGPGQGGGPTRARDISKSPASSRPAKSYLTSE